MTKYNNKFKYGFSFKEGSILQNQYDMIKVKVKKIENDKISIKYFDKQSLINEFGRGDEVKELLNAEDTLIIDGDEYGQFFSNWELVKY